MSSLAKHLAAPVLIQQPCGLFHILPAAYLHSCQSFGFRNIRRNQLRQGEQFLFQSRHRFFPHQSGTAGGYHNRIKDNMRRSVMAQPFRRSANQLRSRKHPNLYGIRKNILKNTIKLFHQKFRRNLLYPIHSCGILGGQRSNCAHPINAQSSQRLEIRLNPRSSAGIASRYG